MNNIIIKKWLEPYVLLESLKKKYEMKDITFDGFTKNNAKQEMLNLINDNAFGLYMKNVNKFYVFSSDKEISTEDLIIYLEIAEDDFNYSEDIETAISAIDLAKAEAVILKF